MSDDAIFTSEQRVRVHVRSFHLDHRGRRRRVNAHVGHEGETVFYDLQHERLNYDQAHTRALVLHSNLAKGAKERDREKAALVESKKAREAAQE